MASVQTFVKAWDTVVTALVAMAPFGSGKVAWGVVGVLLTVRYVTSTVLLTS
jgi:hypothetical protein